MRVSAWITAALLLAAPAAGLAQSAPQEAAAASIPVLERNAAAGDPQAQAALGARYRDGDGVAQDFALSRRWFEAAAQTGQAPAQNALARLVHEGLGGPADRPRALVLFAAAAQAGDPVHRHDYALALEARGAEGDLATARTQYRLASEAGYAPALTSLGVLYLEGRGVGADADAARDLFEQAAAAGDARGQNNLGLLYARGQSVAQDYGRAAALFQRAADQGLPAAMTNLAVLYENGFGVTLDESQAERLYREAGQAGRADLDEILAALGAPWSDRLAPMQAGDAAALRDAQAAQAGDPVALYALAYRFSVGQGRPVDRVRAASLYRQSAQAGFAPAALNLGVLYVRGIGVPQDYVEAYGWLNRAALAEEPGAAVLRDALVARMSQAQRARLSQAGQD